MYSLLCDLRGHPRQALLEVLRHEFEDMVELTGGGQDGLVIPQEAFFGTGVADG